MRRHLPIFTPGLLHHPTPFGLITTEIYSVIRSTPMVIFSSAVNYYVPGDPDLPEYLSSIIEKYHPTPNINKEMLSYYSPAHMLMRSIFHKRNTPLIRLK